MKQTLLAAACLLLLPSLALAQALEKPTISVVGQAEVARPADYVTITGRATGEGKDQPAALSALAKKRDYIEARARRLAGATAVGFETSDIQFTAVRAEICRSGRDYEETPQSTQGPCAPKSFIATLDIKLKFHPAEKIGDAAALVVSSGLDKVQVGETGVDDEAGLHQQALQAAMGNARAQAELLAAASGGKLGGILSITRGTLESHEFAAHLTPAPPAVLTGAKQDLTPDIILKLTPATVKWSTEVQVIYRLDH